MVNIVYKYKQSKPYIRSLTYATRNGKKVISFYLEGQIWEVNGFNFDDVVAIRPVGKGKLLIEQIDLFPKKNVDSSEMN